MSAAQRSGKRYPLLLYTRMLDRWWPALFFIGLGMLALAWAFYGNILVRLTEPWRWMTPASVGAVVILASVVMVLLRKAAYVQAFPNHLRLATPLLRLKISYRRITRVTPATMNALHGRRRPRGLQRDILAPLLGDTALVLDMSSLPVSAAALRLFLSPFFFKDSTPHIVILVKDWMALSTELETMRRSIFTTEEAGRRPSAFVSGFPWE